MGNSSSSVTLNRSVVFVMAFLAAGVFVMSVLGERSLLEPMTTSSLTVERTGGGEAAASFESGVTLSTEASGEQVWLFGGGDVLRLYPDTRLVLDEVNLDSVPMTFTATLESGSVWVSGLQGLIAPELRTRRIGIQPRDASAFLSVSGEKVTVFAAHHPTRVLFLSNSTPPEPLNDYVLAESHRVDIQESSLTEALGELRTTKLTKEYPFVFVEKEEWLSEWKAALTSDLNRMAELSRAFLSELRRRGEAGAEPGTWAYRVQEFYSRVRSWLTFDKSYLNEVEAEDRSALLDQALYLILHGRDAEALERLNRFEASVDASHVEEALSPLIRPFRSVQWGSEFYPVKLLIRERQLYGASPEVVRERSLRFLRERLNEVYDLLDAGERGQARAALLDYNKEWERFIQSQDAQLKSEVRRLTEERQVLANLIFREDVFYSVDSVRVLALLEQSILNLTAQEYDLNEERLAFVQDKIRLLTRLVTLVDEGRVSVKSGLELGREWLRDAEALMRNVTSEVAVTEYFKQRLTDLLTRFDFMTSPEFIPGSGSFEVRLADYLAKEAALDELSAYVSGLQSVAASDGLNEDAALLDAESTLRGAGIAFDRLSLIPRTPQDYRLYRIEGGQVRGVAFEGNYDRLTRLVYDLNVEGEAFSAGVKLQNLAQVVGAAVAVGPEQTPAFPEDGVPEVEASLSPVEKVAIGLARERLGKVSYSLNVERISVQSIERNEFLVEAVFSAGSGPVAVRFTYNLQTDAVTEVMATHNERPFEVPSTTLDGLGEAVEGVLAEAEQAAEAVEDPGDL